MPRSMLLKTLFACTILLAVALPARAQSTPGIPESPEQRISEAFATPYAEAMIRTFVKSVRRSVDSDLLEASEEAKRKAVRPGVALKLGPMQYFAGADGDLAELCVGRR